MEIDKKNTNTTLVGNYLEMYKEYDTAIVNKYYGYVVKTQATQKLGVYLPKLSTIETYDELIKYVEEMYIHGMILGDEFVMKPTEEQSQKIISSTDITLYGDRIAGGPCGFYNHFQDQGFVIETSFGVKIIIK